MGVWLLYSQHTLRYDKRWNHEKKKIIHSLVSRYGSSFMKIIDVSRFACEVSEIISLHWQTLNNSTLSKFITGTKGNLEARWALITCDADDTVHQWHCTNHPWWPISYLLVASANCPCPVTWRTFFPLPNQVPRGHFFPKASLHLGTVVIDWARGVWTVSN